MDWSLQRLSTRLTFSAAQAAVIFGLLSEIDAVKTAFKLTGQLLPQTLDRLTQSVIVTSTGASNRIEGNRLTDEPCGPGGAARDASFNGSGFLYRIVFQRKCSF